MDLAFYWHTLKHWWWLLLLTMIGTIAGIYYYEGWRGIPWQSEVTILVGGPYTISPASYEPAGSGGLGDQITAQYDFTHVGNSASVALKAMDALKLPQKKPRELFNAPLYHPNWPTIEVLSGDPMGDATTGGLLTELLGGSTLEANSPRTHFAVVRSTTYEHFGGEDLAKRLSSTYADLSLDEWRQVQLAAAQQAFNQIAAHTAQARNEYLQAQAAQGTFLVDHAMAPGGSEFQTIQTSIDTLSQQRAGLVAAAKSQDRFRDQAEQLDQQIAGLEPQVDQEAQLLGAKSADIEGERQRLQGVADAAKSSYELAFANQEAARQDIAHIAAQGYPSEHPATTIQHNPAQTTDTTTTDDTAPSTGTSSTAGSTTNPSETTATNGSSHTSSHSTSSSDGKANGQSTSDNTSSDTAGDTTTTSTTIKQGSVTTSTSSTTTNDPAKKTTTTTHTGVAANTQVTVNDNPVSGITSPEQATYYLGTLQFAAQARQGELARALANLAALDASDPTSSMSHQLDNDRAKLDALRQARQAMQVNDGESAAGLAVLDQMILEKQNRLAQLTALQPQFNQLQSEVQLAEARYQQMAATMERYDHLQKDASIGASSRIAIPVKTFQGDSKVFIEVLFGILVSFLIGATLAITLEYVRYSRKALERARNGTLSVTDLQPAGSLPTPQPTGDLGPVGRRMVLPDRAREPDPSPSSQEPSRQPEPRSGDDS